MINVYLLKKLLRDLWQRRGMLLASVMVLAMGVASYTSLSGVLSDLTQSKDHYYATHHLASFVIDLKRAPATIAERLSNLPHIQHLTGRVRTDSVLMLPDKAYVGAPYPIPATIVSLPYPRTPTISDITLTSGRWFSNELAHEVIVLDNFAHRRHIQIGDRLTVRFPNGAEQMLVVGLARSPEFAMLLPPGGVIAPDPGGYAVMFAPLAFLQSANDLTSSINQLLGIIDSTDLTTTQHVITLLSRPLSPYGIVAKTARADEPSVNMMHDALAELSSITTLFPTIFLLVAGLILNVMINRLVTQQRTIIGTLKALGYSHSALLRHYLSYGLCIGIIGGIAGCGIGFALQWFCDHFYGLYFNLPPMRIGMYPELLITGVGIGILAALLGSISGARKALKLAPAEAMRPPAPEKGCHVFLERFPRYWQHCSFHSKMVWRAIFRNRFRSLVTIGASMLATGLILSTIAFFDSMDKIVEFTFDKVQHQTLSFSLRDPLGYEALRTTAMIPGVVSVEAGLDAPVSLSNGPWHKEVSITGVVSNNHLYTPVNQTERPFPLPKEGLVLSQTLATILHVSVGDTLDLHMLLGERRHLTVTVSKIVPTWLGITAYANLNYLSRMIGDSFLTNRVFVRTDGETDIHTIVHRISEFAPLVNFVVTHHARTLLSLTLNQMMAFGMVLIVLFAGIISIGSIINTALISLSERERDIACLRVLGFTNRAVAAIFFGESLCLNAVGIVLGIGLGIYLLYAECIAYSTTLYRLPFVLTPMRILETIGLMLLFILISQAIVLYGIVKMRWFDVLNNRE